MEPEKRKRAIIEAAIIVFARKGYHNASISDIIDTADIARGTFYLYFKSKQEVFEAILVELFHEIEIAVKRIDISKGRGQAYQVLKENIDRIFTILVSDANRGRLFLHSAIGIEGELDEKMNEFYAKVLTLIQRSLSLGMQMNLIRRIDIQVVSLSILGSLKEIIYHITARKSGAHIPLNRDEIIRELLEYNLRGLLSQTNTPDSGDNRI